MNGPGIQADAKFALQSMAERVPGIQNDAGVAFGSCLWSRTGETAADANLGGTLMAGLIRKAFKRRLRRA